MNEVLDVKTPLSNEEIATFMMLKGFGADNDKFYEAQKCQIETTEKMLSVVRGSASEITKKLDLLLEAIGALTASQNELIKSLSAVNNVQSVPVVAKKVNPLFYSTMKPADQNLWVDKVKGEIAKMCLEKGNNRPMLYKSLYNDMKASGYDIDALLKEYKADNPSATQLNMMAASDALRECFEKKINVRVHNAMISEYKNKAVEKPHVTKGRKYKALRGYSYPQEIMEIAGRFNGGEPMSKYDYARAYRLLGVNTKDLVKSVEKKYGIKRVTIPFAISTDKKLVEKFKAVMDEHVAGLKEASHEKQE